MVNKKLKPWRIPPPSLLIELSCPNHEDLEVSGADSLEQLLAKSHANFKIQ